MPDPVEAWDITENSMDFFALVQDLAKGVIQFNKLFDWWVPISEARLKISNNISI